MEAFFKFRSPSCSQAEPTSREALDALLEDTVDISDDDSIMSEQPSTQSSFEQSSPPAVHPFFTLKKRSLIVKLKLPKPSYIVKLKLPKPSYIVVLKLPKRDSQQVSKESTIARKPVHSFFQQKKIHSTKPTTTTTNTPFASREQVKPLAVRPRPTKLPEVVDLTQDDNTTTKAGPSSPPKRSLPSKQPAETPKVVKDFFYQVPEHAPHQLLHVRSVRYPFWHAKPLASTKRCPPPTNCLNNHEFLAQIKSTALPRTSLTREKVSFSRDGITRLVNDKIKPRHLTTLSYLVDLCINHYHDPVSSSDSDWCERYRPPRSSNLVTSDKHGQEIARWIRQRMAHLKTVTKQQFDLAKTAKRKRKLKDDDLDLFIVDEFDNDSAEKEYSCEFLIIEGPPGCGKTASVYTGARDIDAYVFEVNSTQKRTGKDLTRLLQGLGDSHVVHHRENATTAKQDTVILLDDVDTLDETESPTFWLALEKLSKTCRRPIVLTCQDSGAIPSFIFTHFETVTVSMGVPSSRLLSDMLWLVALSNGLLFDAKIIRKLIKERQGDVRASLSQLQFLCSQNNHINDSQVIDVDMDDVDYHFVVLKDRTIPDENPDQVMSLSSAHHSSEMNADFDVMQTKSQMSSFESEESVLPFELRIGCYHKTPEITFSRLNSSQAAETLGCEDSQSCIFASQILPYARIIAQADVQLDVRKSELMESMDIKRNTRRTLARNGLFKVDGHFASHISLEAILATGFD